MGDKFASGLVSTAYKELEKGLRSARPAGARLCVLCLGVAMLLFGIVLFIKPARILGNVVGNVVVTAGALGAFLTVSGVQVTLWSIGFASELLGNVESDNEETGQDRRSSFEAAAIRAFHEEDEEVLRRAFRNDASLAKSLVRALRSAHEQVITEEKNISGR